MTPVLLEDPMEIGRRIGAACGYSAKKQKEIAAELKRDERTLRSYIGGNLGDYSTPDLRLVLIRRIEDITGCQPEIFGVSEPEPEADDPTKKVLARLDSAVTRQARELEQARTTQEEMLTRLEHLEHGAAGENS